MTIMVISVDLIYLVDVLASAMQIAIAVELVVPRCTAESQ